ncbi:TIGR03936 family radical SAM-associated protein [Pelosinus sp. sgz500959]|uniref:TIGR03936 family radical SAM-associated protein n=1 Tax=Pelosinus sp. sgz500959 TaxID=3242472 RepID=UPI00366BEDD9
MAKLRLEITKGEEIRYISHLDYASAMERAIIRAKLPAAYSEGFNPHMKIAFASALAVGVTSQAEYMDLDFKEEVDLVEGVKRLAAKLPPGIRVKSAKYMPASIPALMAIVNLATYDVIVPLSGTEDYTAAQESVRRFNETQEVLYMRHTPKGRKEIEIKQYMDKPIQIFHEGKDIKLVIHIKITPTGSIKPGEVLAALASMFDLAVKKDSALIDRTGLYVATDKSCLTPIEIYG